MKSATLSAILTVMLSAAVLNVTPATTSAQTTNDKQLNAGLDSGKECLHYKVDVPTLVDNDHRIYWKQPDCIIIDVTNNPFRYIYSATVAENTVAEDDVIGTLGSLLGLKSVNSATNASAATPAPKTETTSATTSGAGTTKFLTHTGLPDCTTAQEQQLMNTANTRISDLASQVATIESTQNSLNTAVRSSSNALEAKDTLYDNFLKDYLSKRRNLIEGDTSKPDTGKNLKDTAYQLQADALDLSQKLTGDKTFEVGLVDQFEAERVANSRLSALADNVKSAKSDLHLSICKATNAMNQERADAEKKFDDLAKRIQDDILAVEQRAADVANLTCRYKERKQGEYSWVHDKVYNAVSAVLANPDAFGFVVRRGGPFVDPTSAVLTIKRDSVADDTTTTITDSDNSALECSTDPSKVFDTSKPVKKLADIPAPAATPVGGMSPTPDQTAQKKPATTKATTDKSTQPTTVVLEQPWIFGRARLVLSGGLTPGFLADKQFQRSTSITGSGSSATSSTVIGTKTDSRFRLTPMLYGHVLLWYARHDPDAWYGTLGVTARSDNKGTDPEFLVGLSRSLAQQRFFFTLGAYIGEKQKLDGGLQLGQTIPTSFTGELPVTKSYHVGWGFGISYRFASTKDPQKDTSTQAANNAKQKGK